MRKNTKQLFSALVFGMIGVLAFGQNLPNVPGPMLFQPGIQNNIQRSTYNPNQNVSQNQINLFLDTNEQDRIRKQNEQLIREAEAYEKQRIEAQRKRFAEQNSVRKHYGLPGKNHIAETQHYKKAFNKLSAMNPNDFSVKDATFIIENAFYEEQKDYEEFNRIVKQTGDFLREKMDELGYDKNSNLAKNFMLFKFFADTLEIKSKNLKHLPLEYDFEDYMGNEDWTKMFVHKLLETGKGQCNSLPRLYLILAEEIGAEAFLSLSPNHSYIKFRDEDENWYNVELTNHMFTTDTFILQSGFIKSEAMQNEIYMQTFTNQQLFAQMLTDFAQGYVHKFGHSPFVKEVVDKALELYPGLLNAHMVNANFLATQFEYAAHQVGINPRNNRDLQNVRYFPPIAAMLNEANAQAKKIEDLGFEFMPPEAYENWLNSLREAKQQQDNAAMKRQFNIKLNQPLKN